MSKGNMLLGYSRGSVGDVVLSRVKGQQVAKARNRKPANPKSNKQMKQRSSFISPVKFYTHGVQALFKFAFSDKKVTESDFNAFMRNNSKASFPVTKAENDNPSFPALGNYIMTKGKLGEIPVVKIPNIPNGVGIFYGTPTTIYTVGELSQLFIDRGYAVEGDIITFVSISQQVASMSAVEISLAPGYSPEWAINQFIVDTNNDSTIEETMHDVDFAQSQGKGYVTMRGWDDEQEFILFSMSCVHSRETALGLEVSTSYLHNGGFIDQYIEYRKQKAQVDKVLADWGATGDAILQGSIAKK